jgi:hypothetical protein
MFPEPLGPFRGALLRCSPFTPLRRLSSCNVRDPGIKSIDAGVPRGFHWRKLCGLTRRAERRVLSKIEGDCLPAIPTIAAITAAPAATAVAATPAATTTTASAAVASAPAATTAAALCLGTRFIHHEVSPAEILAVQGIDRAIRVFIAVHFDERETARLARKTVADEIDA